MMTQMQHQDPTNPFKAEQMATQVAQFTSVEQLQNINQSVNKLGSQNKPLEQMMMTNMIGKTVTIDRERFPHSEGENEALGFTLSKNSESTRVSIVGPTGEEVFHKDLGKQNAGEVNLAWDGIGSNSLPAKTGDYTLKVEAKDDRGQNILMNSQAQSRVVGVSFEGTEPVLLVGDGKHQEKITMRNVVRVDLDQGQMGRSPGAEAMRKTNPSPATFMPLPILNNVSAQTASQQVQGSKAAVNVVSRDVEKGFPNGLKD
jgi:flagellar hook assembly protein FlgD